MINIYSINDLIFNVVLSFMIFYIRNFYFMQTIFVEKNNYKRDYLVPFISNL